MSASLLKPSKFSLRGSALASDIKQNDVQGGETKSMHDNLSTFNPTSGNPFAKSVFNTKSNTLKSGVSEIASNAPVKAFVNPFLKTTSVVSSTKTREKPKNDKSLETSQPKSILTTESKIEKTSTKPLPLNNVKKYSTGLTKPVLVTPSSSSSVLSTQVKTLQLPKNAKIIEASQLKPVLNTDLNIRTRSAPNTNLKIVQASSGLKVQARPNATTELGKPSTEVVTLVDDEENLKPERVVKQVVEFQAGGKRKETQRVVFKCKFCDSYFSDETKANQHMKDVMVCDFPGCSINFHGKKDLDQPSHPYNVHRRSHAADKWKLQDSEQAGKVVEWMNRYSKTMMPLTRNVSQVGVKDKVVNVKDNVDVGNLTKRDPAVKIVSSLSSESKNETVTTPFAKNLPLQKYLQKLITVHPSLKVAQEKIVCSTCEEAKTLTEFSRGVVIDRQIQRKVNEHFQEYSDKKSAEYLSSHSASLLFLDNLKRNRSKPVHIIPKTFQTSSGTNRLSLPIVDIGDSPIKVTNVIAPKSDQNDAVLNPKQKVAVSTKIMKKLEKDPLLSKLLGFFETKSDEVQTNIDNKQISQVIQKPIHNRGVISVQDSPMQIIKKPMQRKQIISVLDSPMQVTQAQMPRHKEIISIQDSPMQITQRPINKQIISIQDSPMQVTQRPMQILKKPINKELFSIQESPMQVTQIANTNGNSNPPNFQRIVIRPEVRKRLLEVKNPNMENTLTKKQKTFLTQKDSNLQQESPNSPVIYLSADKSKSQTLQLSQPQRLQNQPVYQIPQSRKQQPVYQIPIATQNIGGGQKIIDLDQLLAEGKLDGSQLVYSLET